MTRATTAGLGGSCSFLCLVGAVVAVKLRQGPAETQVEPANGVTPEQAARTPDLNIQADAGKESKERERLLALGQTPRASPADGVAPPPVDHPKEGDKHNDGA